MQYQQIIEQTNGVYSVYRIKAGTDGRNYCCLVCGKTIQKKEVVYYKSSNLQLCLECVRKTRRPNIPLIR